MSSDSASLTCCLLLLLLSLLLLLLLLLILCTHWHLSSGEAFREHTAATRLTDSSCMNVQLFNFHAAGSSARSSLSTQSPDWEPTGSLGSLVMCKSQNKGCCTSPLCHPPVHALLLLLLSLSLCGCSHIS